ncbi:MAG: nucleotide pyrophosphohydrolase [Gallionella sp.]|nr:nucleotide pyrophosphohydrolase [Gallionella sp.]MDD4958087.1 nucleotide pyrophosphohydrolase [Gallionella sp.]
MSEIAELQHALHTFRDERDWAQFHNPKDLAMALSIEASELLEIFLWKSAEQADLNAVKEELADVFAYALMLADQYDLDVKQIVLAKIAKNAVKYPVAHAKGCAEKYTALSSFLPQSTTMELK